MATIGSVQRFEDWKRQLRELATRENPRASISERALSRRCALRDGFAARLTPREFYHRHVARNAALDPDTPEL